jgi:hypothetical protein
MENANSNSPGSQQRDEHRRLTMSRAAEDQLTINGFLFSKLGAIGTRSEGPAYFVQKFDGTEVGVEKHASLWQEDRKLRTHLATKVTVTGHMDGNHFSYSSIKKCASSVKGCEIQEYHFAQTEK